MRLVSGDPFRRVADGAGLEAVQGVTRAVADCLGRHRPLARRLRPWYERLLWWLSSGRGVPWELNGQSVRISPYQRHRMGRDYDAPVARFLSTRVSPGDVCFDVGANVGVYVLQFSGWTAPHGRVVAFEPNPVSARILHEHVHMNQLTDRVRVVRAAVGERPGTAVLHIAGADGMSRLGTPSPLLESRTQPHVVDVMTIDDFCASHGVQPDWMLIDVEGFEFAVLAGARKTIEARRHRLGMIVEMHPDAWGPAGWTREAAMALLHELGLRAVPLTGDADPFDCYGHVALLPIEQGQPS